jgi:hypothetical protein
MNWKNWLSAVFDCLSVFFVLFLWDLLSGELPHFGTKDYIMFLILLFAGPIGIVGFKELDRGGFWKVRHNLGVFFLALISIPMIIVPLMSLFARNSLHGQITGLNPLNIYFLIASSVFWVAVFPLALHLNRKHDKSTPQPVSTNES